MTEIAIRAESLSKAYRINHEAAARYRTLRGAIASTATNALRRNVTRSEEVWALRDVTFEVARGETLGIIGRNGAGKSTLLKILSRITRPSGGFAELEGRLASLLEVGTGFHPELTGRENVYLNGAILGMRRAEIARHFDEIVDFAGTEQFLETPVKRYSSGMYMRLAFSVAAHLESEILVVDEVLAVGDAAFQQKCLAKMEELSGRGRTVLFVSHNLPAVETLCTTGILLDHGSIAGSGTARDVVSQYLGMIERLAPAPIEERPDRKGDGRIRITRVASSIRTGSPSWISLDYVGQGDLRNVSISVGIFTTRGEGALYLATEMSGVELGRIPEFGTFTCQLERAALLPGRYTLNIYCTVNGTVADWVTEAATIEVAEGDFFGTGRLPPPGYGSVVVSQKWSLGS